MKRFAASLVTLILVAVAAIAGAADPAAVALAAPAPAASVSILDWFRQNNALILGVALAISELLGATPWFKGNGLLDSIVKSLKFLAGKDSVPPAA